MNPPEEEEQCCVICCVDLLYEHFSLDVSDVKVSIVGLFVLKTVAFGNAHKLSGPRQTCLFLKIAYRCIQFSYVAGQNCA